MAMRNLLRHHLRVEMRIEKVRILASTRPLPGLKIVCQVFRPHKRRAGSVEFWISGMRCRDNAEDNASHYQVAPPSNRRIPTLCPTLSNSLRGNNWRNGWGRNRTGETNGWGRNRTAETSA